MYIYMHIYIYIYIYPLYRECIEQPLQLLLTALKATQGENDSFFSQLPYNATSKIWAAH